MWKKIGRVWETSKEWLNLSYKNARKIYNKVICIFTHSSVTKDLSNFTYF